MKKIVILTLFIMFLSLNSMAGESKFAKALLNCSSYSHTETMKTETEPVKSTKKILGIKDGKCVYQESVNYMGQNVVVTCRFSKSQQKELSDVMTAYDIMQNYSKEKLDTKDTNAIKETPVFKVWANYLQDSSVCSAN